MGELASLATGTNGKRYDSTKGPSFTLQADLNTHQFEMGFNAYAIIEGMGEAGIMVKITETTFEGELIGVPVFGSSLTADLYAKVGLVHSSELEIVAKLHLAGLSQSLKDLTKLATKPLEAVKKAIEVAQQVVKDALETASKAV